MYKFFAKKIKDNQFSFFDDDQKHILKVLRLKLNDIIICIYENKKYECQITSINPLLATINNEIEQNINLNCNITLFQAIIKPKYFEWVLIKTTEIGINNIYPVLFSRSQSNNIQKIERNNTIIKTACKQCGRTNIPQLFDTINFDFLTSILNNYDLIFVCYENENNQNNNILKVVQNYDLKNQKIGIIVGPEGGFNNDEISILKLYSNVKFISLSQNILRSETASIYALSVIMSYILK